jgi:hypothetical protein
MECWTQEMSVSSRVEDGLYMISVCVEGRGERRDEIVGNRKFEFSALHCNTFDCDVDNDVEVEVEMREDEEEMSGACISLSKTDESMEMYLGEEEGIKEMEGTEGE